MGFTFYGFSIGTCEEFNSYLDRALLIDDAFGFYNGK